MYIYEAVKHSQVTDSIIYAPLLLSTIKCYTPLQWRNSTSITRQKIYHNHQYTNIRFS